MRTASSTPNDLSILLTQTSFITYSDAVWTFPFKRSGTFTLRRSYWRLVMPMLLLHTDADPVVSVIEIFRTVVVPYPALLLDVTSKSKRFSSACISRNWWGQKMVVCSKDDCSKIRLYPRYFEKLSCKETMTRNGSTYKKLPGNIRLGGTSMSSKKSSRTGNNVRDRCWASNKCTHTFHTPFRSTTNSAQDNLSFKRTKYNQTELH